MSGEGRGTARRALRRVRRLAARAGLPRVAGTEATVLEIDRLERRLQVLRDGLRAGGRDRSPVSERTIPLDYAGASLRIVASAYRRRTAAAKEPFTVAWLERSLGGGGILYDVGANVGGYSLIAGAQGDGVSVVSFEPGYRNYAALCDNIVLNGFEGRITALPIALGRRTALTSFRHRRLITGGGQHDSRTAPHELDWQPEYEQPILSMRLDDVVRLFRLPAPTHVKLDVDGAELEVIQGAPQTLAAQGLKGVLVEMPDEGAEIVGMLDQAGFRLVERHETPAVWYGLFTRG